MKHQDQLTELEKELLRNIATMEKKSQYLIDLINSYLEKDAQKAGAYHD